MPHEITIDDMNHCDLCVDEHKVNKELSVNVWIESKLGNITSFSICETHLCILAEKIQTEKKLRQKEK